MTSSKLSLVERFPRRGDTTMLDLFQHSSPEWLSYELSNAAENLALDEALLDEMHDEMLGRCVVRTWMSSEPVVIVGSSSRLQKEVDCDACNSLGVQIVRRSSGGATVVLGPGCLVWSVLFQLPAEFPSIESIHTSVLSPLARELGAFVFGIRRAGTSDLVVADRKVSGNALRIKRRAVLYHGTLLDSLDLELVSRVLKHPPREPGYRAGREHAFFLSNLCLGRNVLELAIRRAFQANQVCSHRPQQRIDQILSKRYASDEWTERL